MLIYLMVNKHNKENLKNFKSKSDFPDAYILVLTTIISSIYVLVSST